MTTVSELVIHQHAFGALVTADQMAWRVVISTVAVCGALVLSQ